jgi:hypothetical protein
VGAAAVRNTGKETANLATVRNVAGVRNIEEMGAEL